MSQINDTIKKVSSKIIPGRAFKNMTRIQREQALLILIQSPRRLIQHLFIKQDKWNPIIGDFGRELFGEINNEEFVYLTMGLMIYLYEAIKEDHESNSSYLKVSKGNLFKVIEDSFGTDSLILTYYNKFNQTSSGLKQTSFNWPNFYINELLVIFSNSNEDTCTKLSRQISNSFFSRKLSTFGDEFFLDLIKKLKQSRSLSHWRTIKFATSLLLVIILSYNLILIYGFPQSTSVHVKSESKKESAFPIQPKFANADRKKINDFVSKELGTELKSNLSSDAEEDSNAEGRSISILGELNDLEIMKPDTQLKSNLSSEITKDHDVKDKSALISDRDGNKNTGIKEGNQHSKYIFQDDFVVESALEKPFESALRTKKKLNPSTFFGFELNNQENKDVAIEKDVSTSLKGLENEKNITAKEIPLPNSKASSIEEHDLYEGGTSIETQNFLEPTSKLPEDILIKNALKLMDSGSYMSAIEVLKKAIAKNKNHVKGNYYIGLSYMKTHQFKIAKIYFLEVIRNKLASNSFISKSFTEIAKIYMEDNLPKLSYFALGEAITFDPNNIEAQNLRDSINTDGTGKDNFLVDLNG